MQFHKRAYRPMDYRSMANMGTDLTIFQAQQLQGLNQMISTGAGSPEVNVLQRDVWTTIPKQHFEEMQRLSKLSGVEPSVHAPMIDTVGITPQGFYSEEHRKSEEHLVEDVIEKAHAMAPDRNVIVNVHADVITGKAPTTWRKNLPEYLKTKAGRKAAEEGGREFEQESTYGIDQRTGQIVGPLKFEVKYKTPLTPDEKKVGYKEDVWTTKEQFRNINANTWDDDIAKLDEHMISLAQAREFERKGLFRDAESVRRIVDKRSTSQINELYNELRRFSQFEPDNWNKLSAEDQKRLAAERAAYLKLKAEQEKREREIEKRREELLKRAEMAAKKGWEAEVKRTEMLERELTTDRIESWTKFFNSIRGRPPKRVIPLEEFAIDKATKTFAEAAEHSLFDVAKGNINKAPIVAIENPPAMMFGLSRADEMKKLVEGARNKAVELFKKEHKMTESQARRAAEKLIGATWDTGHINLLKKGGYTDKDIIKETEKIAPLVKHFHMADNFGTDETHLPPGGGNVPVKELQKEVTKAGFKGKTVIEAGNFITHFKASPWPYVLDYMDSPIYEFDAAPTWGPSLYKYEFGSATYPMGYGNIFPPQHFSMYGAGFLLPPTFAAEVPGERKRSEVSGTPFA